MHALRRAALAFAAIRVLVLCGIASAQDIHAGVTYVCSGESLLVESCNMRDTSDTSTCLVQHPDRPKHNGFVAYTNETRGTLKKLLPTCTQPGAAQVARADSARKGAQDKQDAILQQNLKLMDTPPPAPGSGGTVGSAKSQRDKLRLTRCLSAGRTEMQCAGNEFGKTFEGVFAFANTLIGGAVKQPDPGLYMLGTYEGKGGWYIEFSQDIAQMACSDLVNESQDYTIKFDGAKTVVRVENKPAPLVFTLREGKLYGGSEPVQVAGRDRRRPHGWLRRWLVRFGQFERHHQHFDANHLTRREPDGSAGLPGWRRVRHASRRAAPLTRSQKPARPPRIRIRPRPRLPTTPGHKLSPRHGLGPAPRRCLRTCIRRNRRTWAAQ